MLARRLAPALLLFAACSDEVGLDRLSANLDAPLEVDFGDVPVGLVKKKALVLKNDGTGSISVTEIARGVGFSGDGYVFGAPAALFAIAPGSEHTLEVSFQPLRAEAAATDLTFHTGSTDASGQAIVKKIVLKGRGVVAAVSVEPNPLDFGLVLAGSTKTLSVKITNLLAEAITLTTDVDGMGNAVVRPVAGGGRFVVAAPVSPDGSLLPGSPTLAPGAFIELAVRYEPEAIATGNTDEARWKVRTCPDALCEVTIDLRGKATDSAIACEPATLDFGAVNPGRTLIKNIHCTNVASDTVTLSPWTLDASTDGAYGLGVFPGATAVMAGGTFDVPVDFTPTPAQLRTGRQVPGVAIIAALGPAGSPLTPARINLTGRAGGPTIEVLPAELHFGPIALGTSRTKSLVVTNSGYEDLIITQIDGDRAMTGAFSATPPSITLVAGTSTVVRVRFTPTAAGPVASTVAIESNDAITPMFVVPVDGAGVSLPPCQYTLNPPNVSYGVIIAGETATAAVSIVNTGTDPCLINDVEIIAAVTPSSHQLPAGPETNVMLAPGDTKRIALRYTPTRTGPEAADLAFYISDPAASDVLVPLFGVGQATTEITCPANQTVAAGAPVVLTAIGMTTGRRVTGYRWTILSAPTGGIGTPNQWTPAPPTAMTETFLPFIVGRYVVEATVLDSDGGSASCQTTIDAEGSGLRVTLTWDGAGDVDLHLHRPGTMQPWFDDIGGNIDDCYYGNTSPVWDAMSAPATGANPELDLDNTFANGPENTSVFAPALNVDYTVGVHNFSRAAGRIATIQIYCGGGIVPVATYTSRALTGSDGGNCTTNDFWKVSAIRFLAPGTCVSTPIDTYVTSADACMSY